MPSRRFPPPWSVEVTREAEQDRGAKREAPSPGLKKVLLGADAAAAGIVARFFAVLFVHFFLLLAGLTGLVIRLLLLLLVRLLLTAAALLALLFTLVRHELLLRFATQLSETDSNPARVRIGYSMCTAALRSTALVAFLLLIFGRDTRLLVRLLTLLIVALLAGLLPVLLIALIGHFWLLGYTQHNASPSAHVPVHTVP